MEVIRLLPIDWQAVAAIMTFLAVAVAFYSSYQYRKREKEIEKREILGKIIYPLRENINVLLHWLKTPYFSNWNWKWQTIKKENPHLIFLMPIDLKNQIEKFDENLERFINLTNQVFPELKETTAAVIRKELLLLVSGDNAINSYYYCKIGGKYFSISFFNLLLAQKNLQEYVLELKSNPALPNSRIQDEEFVVPGFSERFPKEKFERVFSILKAKIEANLESKSYIDSCVALCNEGKKLEAIIKI